MHTYSLQVQHAREKLERLPRKQPTPAQTSKETPKAATPAVVDDSDRYLLTRYDHMMLNFVIPIRLITELAFP